MKPPTTTATAGSSPTMTTRSFAARPADRIGVEAATSQVTGMNTPRTRRRDTASSSSSLGGLHVTAQVTACLDCNSRRASRPLRPTNARSVVGNSRQRELDALGRLTTQSGRSDRPSSFVAVTCSRSRCLDELEAFITLRVGSRPTRRAANFVKELIQAARLVLRLLLASSSSAALLLTSNSAPAFKC